MTKENAAELGKYFIHRYPEAGGIYDAINIPLERAAAIAELMEIAGSHGEQNEVNIYRAAEALRLEILDAQVLLKYHLDLRNTDMNINAQEQPHDKLDIDFEPAFTKEQVFKIEDEYNTTWGVNRRIMISVLSKSGKSMADMLESMLAEDDTGEAYFDMIKCIENYKEHLKSGIELAESATARLLLAAQHVTAVAGVDEVEPTEQA